MGRINPLIAIGVPTWGKASIQWARAYRHLGGPLGSTICELEAVEGKPIADARNELMRQALANNCEFLFFLSDDVLAPGDAITQLLQRMWDNPDIDLITGVYWAKTWPTTPYLWRAMQRGPYQDWKCGEFFQIDFAGCDCLLIRLSERIKALGPEWFSTSWVWEEGQQPDKSMQTEDFYFYTKARAAGIRLWCDSAVQALHEDRASGILFGLLNDMPQAGGQLRSLPESGAEDGRTVIADIGCGNDEPYFGPPEKVKIIRFDINEKVRPDYRCDVRHLPIPDQSVDVAYANHVLEHFGRAELVASLAEWSRIVRVGGEIRIGVPNLLNAMRWILAMEEGTEPPHHYPWWQLYGEQRDEHDCHRNGFTPKRLQLILERLGIFEDIAIEECNNGHNLMATAKKVRHATPFALISEWDTIAEREGITVPGIAPKPETSETENKNNGHVTELATPEAVKQMLDVGAEVVGNVG